ncbi:MAG: bifunctional nuclease family protein [Acidimicrobiales bacterium]
MTPRPRKATTKTPAASAEGAVAVVAPPDGPDAALAAAEETPPGTEVPGTEPAAEAGGAGAGFSLVRVVDVAMVLPNPNPVLVLEELATPRRRLAIPIGLAEGTAISYVLRGRTTPKPLTHELFVDVVNRLGGQVTGARLTLYTQGAYYAEVVVASPGAEHAVSCRPSDAVALALRQGAPATIAVASVLLDQLGTAGSTTG